MESTTIEKFFDAVRHAEKALSDIDDYKKAQAALANGGHVRCEICKPDGYTVLVIKDSEVMNKCMREELRDLLRDALWKAHDIVDGAIDDYTAELRQ